MADYRGGDRHTTVHGDRLINAIENGRTESQRRRNFNQKLAMAGIQAGLQGTRAAIGLAKAKSDEHARAQEDFREYAKTPAQDYTPMKAAATDAKLPGWLTGAGGDTTELGVDNSVMAAIRPDAPANPYDPDPMMTRAEAALSENTSAPKGDEWEWDKGSKTVGRGMMRSQR
jgi:hypothetical protein